MSFWSWLKTASSNASIDPTISWAEGMAPSSVNDSARSMMARLAEYRDDISGLLTTAGTSTAYTITTNQGLATIPNDGQLIAFSPHAVNGIAPTLTADGGTTYPIQSSPGVAIAAGSLVTGSPYTAKFSLSNLSWILFGFYANPFVIPLGASIDYWGSSVPNSNLAFPFGQAISRTTYAPLFAILSTTFGGGDGSTTFNIPDLRGRVVASPDNMGGGSDPARLVGSPSLASSRNSVGATGGASGHVTTLAELPTGITSSTGGAISVTFGGNVPRTAGSISGSNYNNGGGPLGGNFPSSSSGSVGDWNAISSAATGGAVLSSSNNTSGANHDMMPPTILGNRIMRIA